MQCYDKFSDSVKSLPRRQLPPLNAIRLQSFPFFLGEFQFPGFCLTSLTAKRGKTSVSLYYVFPPGKMVTSRKVLHLRRLIQRSQVTTEQLSDSEKLNFSIPLHFIFSWNLDLIQVTGDCSTRHVWLSFLYLVTTAARPPWLSSFVPSWTFSCALWKSALRYSHVIVCSTMALLYYEGEKQRPGNSLIDQVLAI